MSARSRKPTTCEVSILSRSARASSDVDDLAHERPGVRSDVPKASPCPPDSPRGQAPRRARCGTPERRESGSAAATSTPSRLQPCGARAPHIGSRPRPLGASVHGQGSGSCRMVRPRAALSHTGARGSTGLSARGRRTPTGLGTSSPAPGPSPPRGHAPSCRGAWRRPQEQREAYRSRWLGASVVRCRRRVNVDGA